MRILSPGLRAALILTLVIALLAAYYAIHKPVSVDLMANAAASLDALFASGVDAALLRDHLAGALLDVLTVSALFVVGGGVGRLVLRRIAGAVELTGHPAADAALAALLGTGMVGLAVLVIALAGGLNRWVLWGMMVALAVLARDDCRSWQRALVRLVRAPRQWPPYAPLILFFLGTSLLLALAPPFSWDAMVYHLVGPQRYLDAGQMQAYGDNFYLGFPKSLEMLFVITLSALGRDTTPALVHWVFGVFALLLTAALVRRVTDRRGAATAVLLLLASYNLWELFGWGYVDLAIMAYSAACFCLIVRWQQSRDDRLLILTGVLIGLATGVKFTTAFLAAGIGVYVLVTDPRRVVRNGLLIAIPALICVAPWLLRAWALYQNPVYPLLGFGLNWDAWRSTAFTRSGYGMLAHCDGWQLVFLPLTATLFGYNLGPNTSFTLGPFLLTLALLLPLVWRWLDAEQRAFARGILVLALPMVALWTYLAATSYTGTQTRLVIALLPLGAASGALVIHALGKLPRKPLDLGFVVRTALVFSTLLAAVEVLMVTLDRRPLNYFAGTVSDEQYLAHNLGVWDEAMNRLVQLPPGSQVRMLWELRTYHCPPTVTCIPDIMLDQWALPLVRGETPDGIVAGWREAGDDYVLFYSLGYDYFTDVDTFSRAQNLQFPEVRDRYLEPVWSGGNGLYTLYQWRDTVSAVR